MSVKSELEELVKWLSALTNEDKSPATAQPLSPAAWRAVRDNLEDASKKFAAASAELNVGNDSDHRVLAELARDLMRECEDVSRRADMLAKRAKTPQQIADPVDEALLQKAKAEADRAKTDARKAAADAAAAEANRRIAELKLEEARAESAGADAYKAFQERLSAKATDEMQDVSVQSDQLPSASGSSETQALPGPDKAASLLRSAQGTIETARSKLDEREKPAGVTKSFADELDVLAEMALGLRRRCEELAAPPAAPAPASAPAPLPAEPTSETPAGESQQVQPNG